MYGLTQSPNSVTGDNVISWDWSNNVREGGREREEEGEGRRGREKEKEGGRET